MTTPETMRAYGATATVDPIIHNDIAGWSYMVAHDVRSFSYMTGRELVKRFRHVSVAAQVQRRIDEYHDCQIEISNHSVY